MMAKYTQLVHELTELRDASEAELRRVHEELSKPINEFGLGHKLALHGAGVLQTQARRDASVRALEMVASHPKLVPQWFGSIVDGYMGRCAAALASECADEYRLALVGEYDVVRVVLQHVHPKMLVPSFRKSTQVKDAKRPKK